VTLCLTVPSGPAGAIVELQTPAGTVKSPVADLSSGTLLPDGDYPQEPLAWDGAEWAGSAFLEVQQVSGHGGLNLSAGADVLDADGQGSTLQLAAGHAQLDAGAVGGHVQLFAEGNPMVDASATELGFFGAAPVVRPTITGATTQLQVDSLVAALVALGLVIDGR